MDLTTDGPAPPPIDEPTPREIVVHRSLPDRLFRALATAGGMSSLAILGLITVFLVSEAIDPLREAGFHFFTTFQWNPDFLEADGSRHFGIGAMLLGTVVISAIALAIAVPVAVATALYINEYAPRRLQRALIVLIDLLAAIPSLIFGLWGAYYLQGKLAGATMWMSDWFGWIPIFKVDTPTVGRSPLMAGIVLSLMIIPIVCSVSREVMSQCPRLDVEGAIALGGTKWGAVRRVILPFGSRGVVGASMLGLGRAMGETIAVALILSISYKPSLHLAEPGGGSIAALIALSFNESQDLGRKALIAAGLTLFVLTLVINMFARLVVDRGVRRGARQ